METLTKLGHLIGMLDRDQRTAKLSDFNKLLLVIKPGGNSTQTEGNRSCTVSHVPRRTSPNTSYKSRKYGQIWKSILRLRHLVAFGVFFSLICRLPTTHSAPTNRKIMDPRMNEPPKWINPCQIDDVNTGASRLATDSELMERIIVQANNANTKARNMKEEFVQKTFNTNSEQVHNNWKDSHYTWLPSVPKELGQKVPEEHLKGLEFDTALVNSYRDLQTVAVGLEQITWDQEDTHGFFKPLFTEALDNNRNVLCELQLAMFERNIKIENDVTRDVMPNNIRSMDNTSTNLRNWIIYRDYMNVLEYVKQTFTYLKGTLDSH